MGKVRVWLTALLVCVYAAAALLPVRIPVTALTHHFLHANVFHLAANCLAVWMMFGKGCKQSWKELLAGYLIGSLSFLASPVPAVGISDLLFAVLGIRSVKNGWWRTRNFAVLWATLLATAFIPGISGVTHIVSCAGGMLAGAVSIQYRKLSDDYGKARGNQ